MRRLLIIASVSCVVLALALTTVLAMRAFAQSAPQVPVPPVVVDPQPNSVPKRAHSIPTLTPEQQAKAKELFTNDLRAQALFRGHEYLVRRLGPWLDKGEGTIIGVLMDVSLRQPATIEGDWPLITYDETETTYREETLRATARGALKFHVLVDLQREKVVSINPFQPQEIILPPGSNAPHRPPRGTD